MSLFPQKNTTAVQCSVRFRELIQDRPGFWAENVAESLKDCKDDDEVIDFLRWMADPTGSTPGQNKDIKIETVDPNGDDFFKNPDFEFTGQEMGTIPFYKFEYKPKEDSQDDEKIA